MNSVTAKCKDIGLQAYDRYRGRNLLVLGLLLGGMILIALLAPTKPL